MTSLTMKMALAPDDALPHRDELLDEAGVGDRIRAASGGRALSTQRVKAKYRIGESLRVLHKIRLGNEDHFVAARMFPHDRARAVYHEALERAVPTAAPVPPIFFDEAIDTVFWAFPNDRKVAHLSALSDPGSAAGIRSLSAWTSTKVVAYAPERAATAQCLSASGAVIAYGKAYATNDGADSEAIHRFLGRALGFSWKLALPRPLAYSPDHRLLWISPMAGRAFADIDASSLGAVFSALGVALATFHSLPVPPGVPEFARLKPERMAGAAALIARARPDLGERATRVAEALRDAYPGSAAGEAPVHGDINFRNWLIDEDLVSLIDLDQVGRGSEAIDLGGALAGLRYRTLTGAWSAATEKQLRSALVLGYARERKLPPRPLLAWHAGAALFVERTLRAVTRLRRDGLQHLGELVEHSEALSQETIP